MPKIVFVCAPSLGILDNWLPVLVSLRGRLPGAEFVFLAPRARSIAEINLESVLFQVAGALFDTVIFRTDRGGWRKAESFAGAKTTQVVEESLPGHRLLKRLKIFSALRHLRECAQSLVRLSWVRSRRGPLAGLSAASGAVLFDIYEVQKPYMADVLRFVRKMPKYSMLHGIGVRGLGEKPDSVASSGFDPSNTIAFLHSPLEGTFYSDKYGLADDQIKVVGIPRHERTWINYLHSLGGEKNFVSEVPYIFLISRPSNSSYLPRDRKIRALLDIRMVAERHSLRVVIKLHPKESKDGTFEEVFGLGNFGSTWEYSDAHPFTLGMHCCFAVTFLSGVAVDMVCLGVPVIENLDLANLPGADTGESLRNHSGEAVSVYRYLGLVLGSKDSSEFIRHVEAVMADRERVVLQLQQRYREIFPVLPEVSDEIAEMISVIESER